MPSVGTLNLAVQSNAGDVGKDLEQIAGALGRIKKAVPENGLGLSGMAQEIKGFISQINGIKSASTVFKSIEQLGNGLKGIAQAVKYSSDSIQQVAEGTNKAVNTINTKPLVGAIKEIKKAIGAGFNIGMAGTQLTKIKDAIGGEWNAEKAKSVSDILRDIADAARKVGKSDVASVANIVSTVAKSLNEYADAADRSKKSSGMAMGVVSDAVKDAEEYGKTMTRLQQLMGKRTNTQLFGGVGPGSASADWRSTIMGQTDAVKGIEEETARLKEVVSQMQLTDAVVQRVVDNVSNVSNQFSSVLSEETVTSPIRMISESFREAEKYIRYYESGIDAVIPKVNRLSSEHMIEAGNAKLAAMSEKELRVAILDAQGELPAARVVAPVETENVQSVLEFNIVLRETGDIVESVIIPRFREMYEIWSEFAYEFGAFQMQASRLMSGSNPLLLGDGRTAGQLLLGDGSEPETFLSTWVSVGEEFRTNWVMFTSDAAERWRAQWSPDFILGGWNVPQSMSTFHLGAGASPLLLGDGGVSPEKTLSTMVDYSEQWKQDWIIGEGTVSDVAEETERVAAATREAGKAAEEYEQRFVNILQEKAQEAEIAERIRAQQEAAFYSGDRKNYDIGQTNVMADNLTQLDLLEAKLKEAEAEYNQFVNTLGAGASKTVSKGLEVQRLRDSIWEYKNSLAEANEVEEEAISIGTRLTGAWNAFKGGVERMFPTLTSLLKRFRQIVKYRMLRSVLRHITSGFTEGVKNVYQYSKAVGTDLAPAMDRGATALQQMKNSIGAAAAPVIQALVPVLQTVVNWFINLVNYANQFFALMNGQATWTRALPEQAEAFEKSTKSAKKAGKAMKDLLADWDELNIIQSQGGSGAGSATDEKVEEYKNMFEEVSEFSETVRNVVDFIEDKLGGIPGILKKAGIILLGWKLSKAFSGDLATLQNLSMAAGLVLSIVGITLAENAGYNIGRYGISNQNILEAVEGVVATALGGALIGFRIGGLTGAAIGLVLGSVISLFVLGANIRRGYLDSLYGDLHKDADEIRKEIEEKFLTVEAKAQINVTDAQLKDLTDAESKVKGAIEDLNKSYPVDVQITPDNADDFLSKVQTLVNATNTLIEESKETIALSVPATPFFSTTFVNDAWTDVQGYVDELGKLIGEELSNQITDNTNLDQLRKDLLEISNAVLNATNSSEFTGKVGVAGAATRKNTSSGTYDRETVENYIKEYNAYSEEIFGKATAYAQAQYTERERLVASLETAIDQEKTAREKGQGRLSDAKYEKLQKDLEIAIKERDAFFADGEGILEYARKLYDEWSLAGRSMFESDIVSALRAAMGLNADRVYEGQKVINNATMGKGANNDEWVNTYIQSNKNSLMDAISTLTGMPKNQIQQLIENTGLDPLSFFDDEFVSSYRNSIVRWLATSELSDAQKKRVLSSIGLDFDDGVKKMMEEAKKQALASNDMDQLNEDFGRWAFNNMGIFAYKPKEYTEYGQTGYSQGYKFTAPVELQTTEISLDVDELKKEIEEAMTDGWMSTEEYSDLIHKYGQNLFEMTLKELQYNLDEEGYNRGGIRPLGLVASTGVSDTGWTPYVAPTTTGGMESADISNDVAKGTAQGNNEQNDLIQQLINIATRIANKDFKVVVSPSSSWGNFNNRSGSALEKVTGFMNGF